MKTESDVVIPRTDETCIRRDGSEVVISQDLGACNEVVVIVIPQMWLGAVIDRLQAIGREIEKDADKAYFEGAQKAQKQKRTI